MNEHRIEEFLALVRRDLGAADARIVEAGDAPQPGNDGEVCEPPHAPRVSIEGATLLAAELPGDRQLVLEFSRPPEDVAASRERLAMLIESFSSVLEPPTDRPRPPRATPERSLHEELAALADRAGAVDAVVIDAHSPVVWGTAGEDRAAPEESPSAEPAVHDGTSGPQAALRPIPDHRFPLHEAGHAHRAPGSNREVEDASEIARMSREIGIASVDGLWMDARALALVPRAICDRRRVVPLSLRGDTIVLAMADPADADALHDVVMVTGHDVEPVIAGKSVLAMYAKRRDEADVRTYDEVLAAIPREARATREPKAMAARNTWRRHVASRRAIAAVRALPEMASLRKGGHLHQTAGEAGFGYAAHSFAGIYLLLLVFEGPFDELRAKRAVSAALAAIERLVVALPPLEPPPRVAGVVALRGRRRKR